MPENAPVIYLSAGEASGEAYGALLLTELKNRFASQGAAARFVGMGGERMEALGLERVVRSEDVAVMGITEVIRHLPRIYGEFRKLKAAVRQYRPDVAVLIDFPDIHLKLAEEFKRLGIPVIFFVSPQLWAWKKGRIRKVQRFVDRMLVIFPFEEPFYRERGVDAKYVGHPLADLPQPVVSREEFAAANGLDAGQMWIGLLPGSRAKEIRLNLPEMLRAARLIAERHAGVQFLLPMAATLTEEQVGAVRRMVAEFDRAGEEAGVALRPAEEAQGVKPHGSGEVIGTTEVVPFHKAFGAEAVAEIVPFQKGSGVEAVAEIVPSYETSRGCTAPVRLVRDARAALFHARGSIVASGTATVEAALMGNPFVVVYRVSPVTYAIAKRVVTVPHVAMVNLVAERRLVPELIQDDFRGELIVQELEPLLLDGFARAEMMAGLAGVGEKLRAGRAAGETAIGAVASVVLEILGLSQER